MTFHKYWNVAEGGSDRKYFLKEAMDIFLDSLTLIAPLPNSVHHSPTCPHMQHTDTSKFSFSSSIPTGNFVHYHSLNKYSSWPGQGKGLFQNKSWTSRKHCPVWKAVHKLLFIPSLQVNVCLPWFWHQKQLQDIRVFKAQLLI